MLEGEGPGKTAAEDDGLRDGGGHSEERTTWENDIRSTDIESLGGRSGINLKLGSDACTKVDIRDQLNDIESSFEHSGESGRSIAEGRRGACEGDEGVGDEIVILITCCASKTDE